MEMNNTIEEVMERTATPPPMEEELTPEQKEIRVYKAKLAEIVLVDKLLDDQTNPKWLELNDLITPAVLADAHQVGQSIDYPGRWFARRDLKTMERINQKKAMVGRVDLGFKTNCDLMGFRIFVRDVKRSLYATVRLLQVENEHEGNTVLIRGDIKDLKDPKDIIQYMYIYHAREGYLAEYQVGHPFAPLKFKHDSGVRDGKTWALDFSKCPVKVYNLCKNQLLDPRSDFDLNKVWQAGFGRDVPDNWRNAFEGKSFE
jgi:hypothetical protein